MQSHHLVISGRGEASSYDVLFHIRESITTIGSMDSGLALRAPRNDDGGWLFRRENPLKPAQSNKRLEGKTDEHSSRQSTFRCGPAGQAFGRPAAGEREGTVHRRQAGGRCAVALCAALAP